MPSPLPHIFTRAGDIPIDFRPPGRSLSPRALALGCDAQVLSGCVSGRGYIQAVLYLLRVSARLPPSGWSAVWYGKEDPVENVRLRGRAPAGVDGKGTMVSSVAPPCPSVHAISGPRSSPERRSSPHAGIIAIIIIIIIICSLLFCPGPTPSSTQPPASNLGDPGAGGPGDKTRAAPCLSPGDSSETSPDGGPSRARHTHRPGERHSLEAACGGTASPLPRAPHSPPFFFLFSLVDVPGASPLGRARLGKDPERSAAKRKQRGEADQQATLGAARFFFFFFFLAPRPSLPTRARPASASPARIPPSPPSPSVPRSLRRPLLPLHSSLLPSSLHLVLPQIVFSRFFFSSSSSSLPSPTLHTP